jgi:hypothetical protein
MNAVNDEHSSTPGAASGGEPCEASVSPILDFFVAVAIGLFLTAGVFLVKLVAFDSWESHP